MILIILFFLLSYFLESVTSCLLKDLIPLFVLVIVLFSVVLMDDDKKRYIFFVIIGIVYDLTFTNLLFIHSFVFITLGIIIKKILKDYNYIKMLFTYYLVSIIYMLFMSIFSISYEINYSFVIFNSLLNSIFVNTLYFSFVYLSFFGYRCIFRNTKEKITYF